MKSKLLKISAISTTNNSREIFTNKRMIVIIISLLMIITILPNQHIAVKANTAEYAMFPGSTLWVTQGAYGEYNSYSHNGQGGYLQNAFDLGGNDNYRAPFSGTITQIKSSYNAVILQSDNKVFWANGTYDYMSVCFVHDNDISDLYVGKHLNQGDIFYQPGVKDPGGYTTGAHVHVCVNVGRTNSAISYFTGDTRPNEAFYLDTNTAVKQTGNYTWKSVSHVHNYNTYVYFLKTHPHYKCYKCSCGDIKENVNEPTFYDQCEQCVEACKPKNAYVKTDKQNYNVGETVTITPSSEGAKYYTIRICYGAFGDDNIVYSDFNGFTGNKAFVPSQEGTYTIGVSAVGERGYYSGAKCTFVVEGKSNHTQFSAWSSVLPGNVTGAEYDIDTKKMYRYRDNTITTQYGAWGANQTTSTKPAVSATLEIVSTTKYYNYYHYCCNYYGGSYNVDSIAYGTGGIYHTYQSTTELSATNVGDMGGKTLYGNHACSKNFIIWAKASPYETYTYTYRTRTAKQVTVNGAWSSWQNTKPQTANNRDIDEQTYYRYKLKAHTKAAAVKENVKAATYTKAGSYDSVVYCSVCKAELSRNKVTIPMKVGTFKIEYKLNGGKNNSGNPKTFKSNAAVTFKNPTRTGYKFGGWYTDAKFKNKITKITKGTAKNITLYAKWTIVTYKLAYKLNGGKNNAKNPKSYKVTTSAITLKAPTRKGYTFKGWYSDSKFKKKVTKIAKGTTGNKTLYAKWAKK